jgi:hypothetical protein
MDSFTKALQSLGKGLWVQHFGTYESIVWEDESQTVSKEAIEQKQKELQVAYDAQEYSRNRKVEYDALNQFELISDDDTNGTTTHKDAIAAIKAKYPKPK